MYIDIKSWTPFEYFYMFIFKISFFNFFLCLNANVGPPLNVPICSNANIGPPFNVHICLYVNVEPPLNVPISLYANVGPLLMVQYVFMLILKPL